MSQALPRGLLLPLQSPLLTGGDDREDRQGDQLLHALHGTGSEDRGGLWVIKFLVAFQAEIACDENTSCRDSRSGLAGTPWQCQVAGPRSAAGD